MNENVKVSVIMPAYNAERFIAKSIESVVNQTYTNIEFVIVNDGSADSTADIIRRYESQYPEKILFVDKDINEGTAKTLNIAMGYATGEYMCWLSADDLYVNTMVESSLSFLLEHPEFDACHSLSVTIDENDKLLYTEDNSDNYHKTFAKGDNKEFYMRMLLSGNCLHGCSMFGKRDSVLKAGGFDPHYRYAHDYAFWLRMIADANIGFVNQYNVMGRSHAGQVTRQGKNEIDAIDVYNDLINDDEVFLKLMVKAGYSDRYKCAREGYINRILVFREFKEELTYLAESFGRFLASS